MSLLLFAQCRRASALGKEFDQLSTGSVSLWDGLHCPVVEHAVVDLEPGSGTDGAGVEMQLASWVGAISPTEVMRHLLLLVRAQEVRVRSR